MAKNSKVFGTISSIIAAIAAIFFGVPAFSYKENRKEIVEIVVYDSRVKNYESFFEYVKRYWKELFAAKAENNPSNENVVVDERIKDPKVEPELATKEEETPDNTAEEADGKLLTNAELKEDVLEVEPIKKPIRKL